MSPALPFLCAYLFTYCLCITEEANAVQASVVETVYANVLVLVGLFIFLWFFFYIVKYFIVFEWFLDFFFFIPGLCFSLYNILYFCCSVLSKYFTSLQLFILLFIFFTRFIIIIIFFFPYTTFLIFTFLYCQSNFQLSIYFSHFIPG